MSDLTRRLLEEIYGIHVMYRSFDGTEFGVYRDSTVDVLHRVLEVRDAREYLFYEVCNSLSELEELNLIYEFRIAGVGLVYDVTGLGVLRVLGDVI